MPMRTTVRLVIFFLLVNTNLFAQITTPIIKARFGVDADLRANYFNGLVQTGNDDWFNLNAADTSGKYVIDTTGAAAMIAGYLSDVSPWPKRMSSFYRTMSKPQFSIINNRLWLDAIYVRDYHGNDTTVYTSGSDKNGMSPALWTGGTQGIPDKNDILDMFVHVRRAGPNATDSLWMFGGISLDNTTGNRYFDFEMYQTDIYYDRPSAKFYGFGPDAGHTSWKFNAAGNITIPGDIIFNGEFQSGTLSKIEARIWVKKTDWQTIVPSSFNWSGLFDGDGAGALYGYASIAPNTLGAFYTGLGSANNTWAGPFGLVLQDNSLAYTAPAPASTTNSKYIANQFIEFSVNLTKLGLDPVSLLGGDVCGTPFNRIVVKTRASASFTAELKDFVAPTDLFLAPRANIETQTPFICDTGSIARIYITNPSPTSVYQWSTTNGRIVGPTNGTSIFVDTPGVYIVKQYLQAGCSLYASDTITIGRFQTCIVLKNNLVDFRGTLNNNRVSLKWKVLENQYVQYFDIERSFDGINFSQLTRIEVQSLHTHSASYEYSDDVTHLPAQDVYYRLRMKDVSSKLKFSNIIRLPLSDMGKNSVTILPNPVKDNMQLQISSISDTRMDVRIYDETGKIIATTHTTVQKGINVISLYSLADKPKGVYQVIIFLGNEVFNKKILVAR